MDRAADRGSRPSPGRPSPAGTRGRGGGRRTTRPCTALPSSRQLSPPLQRLSRTEKRFDPPDELPLHPAFSPAGEGDRCGERPPLDLGSGLGPELEIAAQVRAAEDAAPHLERG